MKKRFNITGNCQHERHYMVDLSEKLVKIQRFIDNESYFTINRGRQYGKTTTLAALVKFLADAYTVVSISFESLGSTSFENEAVFCEKFLDRIIVATGDETWNCPEAVNFVGLSKLITKKCANKKIVLMVDEVDKASNYHVFLGFLNMLRSKFIDRSNNVGATFHSVILAGVYDIKNIKFKMVQDGTHRLNAEEVEQNSPWNIAEKFTVDMSFSVKEISTMLIAYEKDHQTGMNITQIATEIYAYTNGYPVLVSTICRYIDEDLESDWSISGVEESVRRIVRETDNELFKSLAQNLERNDGVRNLLYDALVLGKRRSFSTDNPNIELAFRYGYIKEVREHVKVFNRIFEMRLSNYFITKDEERGESISHGGLINEITKNGQFDMALCLERFALHWQEIYNEKDAKFYERQCRMIFLTYLKPILNGCGFYFIESTLTDDRRMDVVVIYNQQRFILELKIWKGQLYNEKGVEQLLGYVKKMGEDRGYLLTFDFRKNPERIKPLWRTESGAQIFEVRV